MSIRRVIFWFHLVLGLVVGLTICFFASTGSLMAFQTQIIRLNERHISVPPHTSGASCSSTGQMLRNVQSQIGVPPTSLQLFNDPRVPAQVMTAPDSIFLIDPCTGALLENGPSKVRAFCSHVRDLHRYAAYGGKRYQALHAITTAGNLGFPILILSGVILWVPRQWRRAHLQNALIFRKGLRARAREWNLHTVAGFWLAVPLVLISLSGSVMAYDWVNALMYKVAGSPTPQGKEERPKVISLGNIDLLDTLLPIAKTVDPHWNSLMVRFPLPEKNIPFALDGGAGSEPRLKTQLVLSRKGKPIKSDTFDKLPRGRQWRLYNRYLHTGEIFGIVGQFVAFLAALTALLLVWTGFALSVRRFNAWRGRRARARARASRVNVAEEFSITT